MNLAEGSFFESLRAGLHHLMQRLQHGKHALDVSFSEVQPRRFLESLVPQLVPQNCHANQLFTDLHKTNTTRSSSAVPCTGNLHWLRIPERIQFRLCVLAYCVHGTAPAYLADSLRLTSEFVARRHLRSADTTTLLVPPTRRVTLGDRAFPVAVARAWNGLPAQIRAASSLLSFRWQTKTHLFQLSYN